MSRRVLPPLLAACVVLLAASVSMAQVQVTRMTAPQKIAPGETVSGEIFLATKVDKPTRLVVQWRDTFGRIGGAAELSVPAGADRTNYSLPIQHPIVRRGSIEVLADGRLLRAQDFAVVFPPKPWDDYRAFVWAHYPRGSMFDILRQYGINGAMVYRDEPGDPIKDAGFDFYIDQMCWEVYAWYHKVRYDWKAVKDAYAANPRDYYTTWRRMCLHEEGTYAKVEENYSKIVTAQRDDRPSFYNLADEIGLGDQSGAMDFCWTYDAREGWIAFLKARYGTVEAVSRQWGIPLSSWGSVRAHQPTTNRQFGRLWREVYLPKAFKAPTDPQVQQQFKSTFESFDGIVDLYLALVTSQPVDVKYIENWIKGIDPEAAPAGSAGEQVAPEVKEKAEVDWVNRRYAARFASLQGVVDFYSAFENWSAALAIDNTRIDPQALAGWNLSQWCDFREYMDQTMADALARGVEIGRKYDPVGRFGFTGTHHPGVFSGQNYAKVCQAVDLIVPYNIGQSPEIIRSLYPQRCIQMTPSWFSGNRGVWDIWTRFLDGDKGIIFWDNEEPKNKFLNQPDGSPTERATTLGPTLRTIESGLAKLLYASDCDNSGIALYYSHPSVRVAWWRQYLPVGRKWVELQSWNLYGDSYRNLLRNSWCRLLEDCNVQFDFVSHEQVINEDRLSNYRVLILPETFALSDMEAARIQDFVANGGILIADNSPGIMDEHGKWREQPALANLFDDERAFLLNASVMMYSRLRLEPGQEREMRAPIEKILFDAGQVVPSVRVIGAEGQALTAAEVHTYHSGPGVRVISVGRSMQRSSEGPDRKKYENNAAFEKVETVTLDLDRESHVYDVLAGKYLGQGQKMENIRLDPYVPTIWTLSDEELPALQSSTMEVEPNVVEIQIASLPADVLRVARVEVLTPAGAIAEHYCGNVLLHDGRGWHRIPFALNDAAGKWTVRIKDVATGQGSELTIER